MNAGVRLNWRAKRKNQTLVIGQEKGGSGKVWDPLIRPAQIPGFTHFKLLSLHYIVYCILKPKFNYYFKKDHNYPLNFVSLFSSPENGDGFLFNFKSPKE